MTGVFYADLNRLESQSISEGRANNSPLTSTDDCLQLANTPCGSGLGQHPLRSTQSTRLGSQLRTQLDQFRDPLRLTLDAKPRRLDPQLDRLASQPDQQHQAHSSR
jgi:hypothetical protein